MHLSKVKIMKFPNQLLNNRLQRFFFEIIMFSKIIRKTKLNIISILFFFSLFASLFTACVQTPQDILRVGFSVWPGYESLFLSRDLGYYNKNSIKLIDYPSNSEIIRAFRNGDLDVATLTIYEALLLSETDPTVRIALILDSSSGADVILAKPEIKTIETLKNLRVGVESGALGAFVLTRALEKTDLTSNDIKVVSLGVSEHEEAFYNGMVDAIVTYEPTRSKLLLSGANLLFDSKEIPGEIIDVLVVRGESITKDSRNIQLLINGYFRALNYLQTNPQNAAQRISPREGLTSSLFLKSLEGIHIPSLQENKDLLGKLDTSSIEKIKRVSHFMQKHKLLRSTIDPSSLFNDTFLKSIQ